MTTIHLASGDLYPPVASIQSPLGALSRHSAGQGSSTPPSEQTWRT
jgi:hypothetical protein